MFLIMLISVTPHLKFHPYYSLIHMSLQPELKGNVNYLMGLSDNQHKYSDMLHIHQKTNNCSQKNIKNNDIINMFENSSDN